MDKLKTVIVGIFHIIWMVGICLCSSAVEYGILSLTGGFGMNMLLVGNVIAGTLIYFLFYKLEQVLVAQELSLTFLFVLVSYFAPIGYNWFMVKQYTGLYGTEDAEVLTIVGIFTFTCLLLAVAAILRGMTGLYQFVNKKMSENRPLMVGRKKR